MLGKVISKVFGSPLPVQAKLILFDSAAHPVESHVNVVGAFPAHVAVEDAMGGCNVGLRQGGRLRVTHLGEDSTDGDGLLANE